LESARLALNSKVLTENKFSSFSCWSLLQTNQTITCEPWKIFQSNCKTKHSADSSSSLGLQRTFSRSSKKLITISSFC